MKKLFIVVPIFLCAAIAFVYFTGNDPVKSQEETEKISFYKKYSKQINEVFTVDSIEYSFKSFYYSEYKDSTVLKVFGTMKNKTTRSLALESNIYKIQTVDAIQADNYLPSQSMPSVLNDSAQLYLKYKLPERVASYHNYQLLIESKKDSTSKALLIFYKSYRAEG